MKKRNQKIFNKYIELDPMKVLVLVYGKVTKNVTSKRNVFRLRS